MRSKYRIADNAVYFITSTVVEWMPVFTSKPYFDILVSSIQYCQEHKNLSVYAYVILDNHFHMLCETDQPAKVLQSLKRHTAKKVLELLENDRKKWLLNALIYYKKAHKRQSSHQLWQEGFHPQQISTEEMFRQKAEYIHYNPVKRGYVSHPECWVYSSARDFYTNESGYIKLAQISE